MLFNYEINAGCKISTCIRIYNTQSASEKDKGLSSFVNKGHCHCIGWWMHWNSTVLFLLKSIEMFYILDGSASGMMDWHIKSYLKRISAYDLGLNDTPMGTTSFVIFKFMGHSGIVTWLVFDAKQCEPQLSYSIKQTPITKMHTYPMWLRISRFNDRK